MKHQIPVMAHLVIGYPTLAESFATAEKYVTAGCRVLELQIPFSHPTADGPVITGACREAVENQRVSMLDCLAFLATCRARFPRQEIVAMSYLNRVFAFGLEKFAGELERLGIRHCIIPDLPVDSGLALRFQKSVENLRLVPVLAANVSAKRLQKLLGMGFDFFYLMSDFKITGSGFGLHPRLRELILTIKTANPAARTGIGFGISTPEQVRLAAAEADLAIVGSALILAQRRGGLDGFLASLAAGSG